MRDETALPSAKESIASIRTNGDPFANSPLSRKVIEGVTYEHPKKDACTIEYDKRVASSIPYIYTDNGALRKAFTTELRDTTYSRSTADFIGELRRAHLSFKPFWGFSGYASIGPSCELEADVMELIYGYLSQRPNKPRLVSDGGSGAGVLALNGVLAQEKGIESVGFTPFQGVGSMSPRDQMVICRPTYQDREVLVGTLPDILVCVGGGGGTKRECIEAIEAGVTVLIIALRDDGPTSLAGSWQQTSKIVDAEARKQLRVSEDFNDILKMLEEIRHSATAPGWRQKREQRINKLARLLRAS